MESPAVVPFPVCLLPGEIRGSGPEPFKLRVSLRNHCLRVSLTDFFMSRVETPVLCCPVNLSKV